MMFALLIAIHTFASPSIAQANVLHFQNYNKIEWTVHSIKSESREAEVMNGALAILNLHETKKSVEATVYVKEYPLPPGQFGRDKAAWHNFIFSKPVAIKAGSLEESVLIVGGRPRYLLSFETDGGTGLQSLVMATISNGKLQILFVEQHADVMAKIRKPVLDLYKTVAILSTSN